MVKKEKGLSRVIVVLGGPNDDKGNLSTIALSRCDLAWSVFKSVTSCKVLCTGGIGDNFNPTKVAHGEYTKQYLINKGIPAKAFLETVHSRFTFEDAVLSKPILQLANARHITLITSDFHMNRARYIFSHVFKDYDIDFMASDTLLSPHELTRLQAHELSVMEREAINVANYADKHRL